jgi:hypothetical protein
MKQNILSKAGLFILLVAMLSSCSKWIDPDMNINPDAPTVVPMDLLLPTIEARFAYNIVQGNDGQRTLSLWIQHMTGIARQSQAEGAYSFRAGDANNNWGSVYSGVLMDIKQLVDMSKQEKTKSTQFEGVGKILKAATIGHASDLWGDIPFSEALQGDENLKPAFDSQKDIYASIQSLLDEGIYLLKNPDAKDVFTLDGDIIFGGKADKWIAAAYALKARYALHLSKVNNDAYTKALDYLENAMDGASGSAYYYYADGNNNNANPLFLFMQDRGDIRVSDVMIDGLKATNDPRIVVYANPIGDTLVVDDVIYPPGSYVGAPAGVPLDGASTPGSGIASSNTKTPIITFTEVKFIEAECKAKTGDEDGAKDALKAAVAASLNEYGVYNEGWVDTVYNVKVDDLSGNALYEEIMNDKWVALMYNFEAYNDWRRTGLPKLTPNPVASGKEIPRRFPYPTDALTYNPNTPQGVSIWDRIWWDK